MVHSAVCKLTAGPWRLDIPNILIAGEEFEMKFHCMHPDSSLCPPYYQVMFHGPSRQGVLPEMFSTLNWTYAPDDYASVTAYWTIYDPGEYLIYAYPQFMYCKKWKDMEYPWNKATVQGTPIRVTVVPGASTIEEGYETCSSEDIEYGRYLSTDAELSSEKFAEMYAGSGRKFVWAPYKCKIPHRTIGEAVNLIPSAKHFLFVGDSLTRGGFCARIWENIHGTVAGSVCDYKSSPAEYWDMKWGHKFTHKVFETNETGVGERNVSFSYLWVGHNFSTVVPTLLSLNDPPPTHVVFNMGMYGL